MRVVLESILRTVPPSLSCFLGAVEVAAEFPRGVHRPPDKPGDACRVYMIKQDSTGGDNA